MLWLYVFISFVDSLITYLLVKNNETPKKVHLKSKIFCVTDNPGEKTEKGDYFLLYARL